MFSPRATRRAWVLVSMAVALTVVRPGSARAQTIDDGVMMAKGELFAGALYTHDQWDQYWEGGLKRDNGNIGTLTTESNTVVGVYGITDRLNLLSNVPYIWTEASQGVLHGMNGVQDLSIAAKYTPARAREISGRRAASPRGLRRRVPADRLHAGLPCRCRLAAPARALSLRGTASMQGADGVVRRRVGRLHLAFERHARSAVLLHRTTSST